MAEEATAVNEQPVQEAVQDTSTTESAPVETKTDEDKAFESMLMDSTQETKEEPTPSEDDKTTPEETNEVKSRAEQRKEQLQSEIETRKEALGIDPNTEIRDLVAARNALRELENAKAYQSQLTYEQQLLEQINPETGDYFTPREAERYAKLQTLEEQQQRAQMETQQLQIVHQQQTLHESALKAINDFPQFDENSKDYNPELASQADAILGQSLVFDPNDPGRVIGSRIDPYTLYQALNSASSIGATKGQLQGKQDMEKMLANVDNPNTGTQKKEKEDDFIKGFSS